MNYDVICTGYNANERHFTIGVVYKVINNTITSDNGFCYGSVTKTNILDWLKPWYNFEVVGDKTIIITTDGTVILARHYEGNKVIKTATAKCSPKNTFNFEKGAKLAFDRLIGEKPAAEEKPEYYNGKVVCIRNNTNENDFTVGKLYEFIDGQTIDNEGDKRPYDEKITSLDYYSAMYEFIPFVE